MKKPSFTSIAKNHFKTVLADMSPVFEEANSAIVQQRHPEWESPTQWAIGESLTEAKLIADLLPANHVRTTRMENIDGVLLAEVTEISQAAFDAIFAWQLSGGDGLFGGVVKLEAAAKRPASRRPHPAKELFATLLAKQPNKFRNVDVILERQHKDFVYPTQWKIGGSLEDIQQIAAALPKEHVIKSHLRVVGQDITLADVTMFSDCAIMVIAAWFQCNRSTDLKKVSKKLKSLEKHDCQNCENCENCEED